MAKRSENHKLGDLGEQKVRLVFAEAGFAVSEISPDYGEDFFSLEKIKGLSSLLRFMSKSKPLERRISISLIGLSMKTA